MYGIKARIKALKLMHRSFQQNQLHLFIIYCKNYHTYLKVEKIDSSYITTTSSSQFSILCFTCSIFHNAYCLEHFCATYSS